MSVSSHDPSARPIIPRAQTRWKRTAAAGEQCFGSKNSKARLRGETKRYRVGCGHVLVSVAERYLLFQFKHVYESNIVGCKLQNQITVAQASDAFNAKHHCFGVLHGPFNAGFRIVSMLRG